MEEGKIKTRSIPKRERQIEVRIKGGMNEGVEERKKSFKETSEPGCPEELGQVGFRDTTHIMVLSCVLSTLSQRRARGRSFWAFLHTLPATKLANLGTDRQESGPEVDRLPLQPRRPR